MTTLIPLSFASHTHTQGGKEYMMRAHFGLPSVESEELDAKRPITVNFEIPYFTVSGIQVGPLSTHITHRSVFVFHQILSSSFVQLLKELLAIFNFLDFRTNLFLLCIDHAAS